MHKVFLWVGIIAAAIVALGVAIWFSVGLYLSPQSKLAHADAIVAISGGETGARTQEAVRLYNEGYAPLIIFSGAALDPNGPSNARAMANAAEQAGVPASAIRLDETSVNTRENAANVAKIITNEGAKSIILVTSPYHQRRALITFRRALGPDATIINHSSYDQNWRRSHWWATSYSRSLTFSELQKVIYELVSNGK